MQDNHNILFYSLRPGAEPIPADIGKSPVYHSAHLETHDIHAHIHSPCLFIIFFFYVYL